MDLQTFMRKFLIILLGALIGCAQVIASANANSFPNCDPSVLKPQIVKTPSGVTPVIAKYVKENLQNSLKTIEAKSRLRAAPAYTLGIHNCYFTDLKIESSYTGFLPKGVPFGYQVQITLKKEKISGGYSLFISLAKVSGKWKVLASGPGL